MTVIFSENAETNLDAIHAHIARYSEESAKSVIGKILRRAEQIAAFPMSGRSVPELGFPQIREVFEHPYRIMYRINADRVEIIAILHESMDFEQEN